MRETINPLTWRFDLVGDGETPIPTPPESAIKIVDKLPVNWDPTEIYVMDGTIYVWDDENSSYIETDWNTKAFFFADIQDTQTAQEAYNRYAAGKYPIVVYNNHSYTLADISSTKMEFRGRVSQENQNSSTFMKQDLFIININNWAVTTLETDIVVIWWSFLRLGQNYSIPYTPTQDWEPATKKYTDEHGPEIPVFAFHWSITGTKTFSVSVPGTYKIIMTWARAGLTNRNITVSADWTTVATYTASYSWLVNACATITATSTIWLTLDTDITISDIIISKIDVQSGYIYENIS